MHKGAEEKDHGMEEQQLRGQDSAQRNHQEGRYSSDWGSR